MSPPPGGIALGPPQAGPSGGGPSFDLGAMLRAVKPSAPIGTKPCSYAGRADAPPEFREADALLAQLREGLERACELVTEARRTLHRPGTTSSAGSCGRRPGRSRR